MRSLLFALCAAVAVMFTASPARAEGAASQGRCLIHWASFDDAPLPLSLPEAQPERPEPPAPAPVVAASLIEVAPTVAAKPAPRPGQSRAPRLCVDPDQPECQVHPADPPHRGGIFMARHELTALVCGDLDVPPPDAVDYDFAAPRRQGPMSGHARPAWRPPSA